MSGPTFSVWYQEFTPSNLHRLRSTLIPLATTFHPRESTEHLFEANLYIEGSGTIGVEVDRREFPQYVLNAFRSQVGWVPNYELSAYCMAKGNNDWNALRLLATRVASTLGGWIMLSGDDSHVPSFPVGMKTIDERVKEVVALNEEVFFGALITDEAYVAMNREFVPRERYWLIDVRVDTDYWVGN